MHILDKIYDKAKKNPARIIFPEAENLTMLEAVIEATNKGYLEPVLLGNKKAIGEKLSSFNTDGLTIEIIDITDESDFSSIASDYCQLPQAIYREKAIMKRLQLPLYHALILQALGKVDCTFAGLESTTGEVILAGQSILGLKPGISSISSYGILEIPGFEGSEGNVLAFGDSAVAQNPSADELAHIAIQICDSVAALLDWQPRCAMLSYSSLGSGQGNLVEKVQVAVAIANELRSDLLIEGEFQLDTALVESVAKKKVKQETQVAGKANVIVFPDLNAGNLGVKSVQIFSKANAYGPTLLGFNGIIADCSRSAPVSELVGNIAIASVRAKYENQA